MPGTDKEVLLEWLSFCRVRAELTDLRACLSSSGEAFSQQAERLRSAASPAAITVKDQQNHLRLEYLYRNRAGRQKQVYDPWFRDCTAGLAVVLLRGALVGMLEEPVDARGVCAAQLFFFTFSAFWRASTGALFKKRPGSGPRTQEKHNQPRAGSPVKTSPAEATLQLQICRRSS